MFPCYVTNPCPASCHNDFPLLVCQPRGIHARGCSNETCLTVVSVVSPLKRDYLLIIRGGVETVVTADQRCQAGYSSAWASPAAGALCGAKVNVSTGLACSSAARLVVNHRPLMYQIKTLNDSNNKRKKSMSGEDTAPSKSLKVFTAASKLEVNFFFIPSPSCLVYCYVRSSWSALVRMPVSSFWFCDTCLQN